MPWWLPWQRRRFEQRDLQDEIATGRHPAVVISDGLWRRDFEADPAIVGRTIEINSYPMTSTG